jgi:hypothetical protein
MYYYCTTDATTTALLMLLLLLLLLLLISGPIRQPRGQTLSDPKRVTMNPTLNIHSNRET